MSARGIFLVFCLVLTIPALFYFVHGEVDVKETNVPTPDATLRSNERVASKTDDEVIAREEEQINPDGFSVKELKLLQSKGQKHTFQAEVSKLMNIIINSLYSNSEIFLRELISNASDALDKIRFLALTDPAQLKDNSKLEIKIRADPKTHSLHITDTGIGMTREHMLNNLGTIARSGTAEFLKTNANAAGDTNMIGQFGVGFYSVFLVADTVTVISKHNDDVQQVWQSDAQGEFTISEDPRGNTLGRGTEISIHLKEDAYTYLEDAVLEKLVSKYSEFINFPIYLWSGHEESREVAMTEEEIKAEKEKEKEEDEEVIEIDTEEKKEEEAPRTKTVTETVWDWKLMNQTKPLWTRNAKDITEEEYVNFYKAFTKTDEDPLFYNHFNAEGEIEFKSILYIPSSPPPNMYDPQYENLHKGLKLYVRRVFITDDFRDILPKYLSFLKGLVDSDDLPLNVSREMLQESKTLQIIKKKIVRKAVAMFQQLAEDKENKQKYIDFWKNFGTSLKLGVIEDSNNRQRLAKLLMFHSSKTTELASLQDYVDRMKEGQTQIYYLAGENLDVVSSSPLLERLIKKGFEVLYMTDPIDEYAMGNLEKFDGKYKLTNIAREGLKIDGEDDKEEEKKTQEEFSELTSFLKKSLSSKIDRAVVSNRLTQSPSALVSSSYGWTANMERIVKAQALGDTSKSNAYAPKKVLEINPRHPLIKELNRRVKDTPEDQTTKDISDLLYETAALTSGFTLDDPSDFAARIVKMLNLSLNLDPNTPVDEEPEPTPAAHHDDHDHDHDHDEL